MFGKFVRGCLFATLLTFASGVLAAAKVGDTAPDIAVGFDADGKPARVADFAGKVVVVSFWASWCGPCRKELPVLDRLQVAGKGHIQVIAVNIEERAVFRKVIKALEGLHVMLANDRNDRSQSVYQVKAIPQMVIIGRDGRILSIHRGYGEDTIDSIVDEVNRALLANEPATHGAT